MGYNPNASDEDKLKYAMRLFHEAVDYRAEEHQEAHRAGRFIHNSQTTGQWEEGDLAKLREAGRAAFSFNLVKATVDKMIGMHRDGMRKATAMPVGGEDAFVAEMVNALADRIYKEAELDKHLLSYMASGYYHGEGNLMFDVRVDADDPSLVDLDVYSLSRYEVHWDPSSRQLDHSDAGHVYQSRWLSRAEFVHLYPDHASSFDKLKKMGESGEGDDWGISAFGSDFSEPASFDSVGLDSGDYRAGRHYFRQYFESRKGKIRVIHGEFRVPEKRYFLRNVETGQSERIKGGKTVAQKARDMIAMGALGPAEVVESWGEEIYYIDFIGKDVLASGKSEQPFDGFSVDGWCYAIDSETGEAYGPMRNFFDPQMEINKAWSLGLEQIVGQGKPGYIAEQGAIKNLDAFEEAYRSNAAVALVENGALTENRVQPRQVAQFSPAAQARLQNSIEMLTRIAGVGTEMESPAQHAEAAMTQMLRYHQARLSMASVVEGYECALKRIFRRIVQMIVRAVPDAQLMRMLGNDDRFGIEQDPTTGESVLVEYQTDEETGQRSVVNMASIRSLRDLQYDIELEVTSENGTARLAEAQQLFALEQARPGSVDPALLVSKVVASRHERERLQKYAEDQAKSQARAAEQQQQMSVETLRQSFAIEQQKNAETARHNQADEMLKAQKQAQDHQVDVASVYEQADTNEKQAILKLMEIIQKRQEQRTIQVQGVRR